MLKKSKFEDSLIDHEALPDTDIAIEIRHLLELIFRMLDLPNFGNLGQDVTATITSAVASFVVNVLACTGITLQQSIWGISTC